MSEGARSALLGRLIDHAAMFPPASLPLDAALEVDRHARSTPEAWLLNRFLVPASHLPDVPAGFEPPIGVIVDTDGPPDLQGRRIESVEVRLEHADLVAGVEPPVFLEVWAGDASRLREVADLGAGAKVRCGGATPDMFPSPGELAAFIVGCRDLGLRFKATAGLHHPLRDGIVHGFLNLLGAAVVAHAAGGGERDLIDVLLADDAAAFSVTDDAFQVAGRAFGAEQVAASREELFVGYGSCSFSEPVEDLKGLGVL
jgi:hypothetical protein